jgi:hypothetical protein
MNKAGCEQHPAFSVFASVRLKEFTFVSAENTPSTVIKH